MSKRAEALAQRVAQGHQELVASVKGCSEAQWQTCLPDEDRSVGVVVHHIASALPVEIDLVKALASGKPITGVTLDMVDQMNAQHAGEHAHRGKDETLKLLKHNSEMAIAAIRALSDKELDRAAPVSLHADAPLTTQYFIEDHPLAHSFHHLAAIRAAIGADCDA